MKRSFWQILMNHQPSALPAGPHCTPPGQRRGWGWPAPQCLSLCCRCRRTAAARQRSASPIRWCVAPGNVCTLSLTQWGCGSRCDTRESKKDATTAKTDFTAANSPDSNFLDIRDKSADPRFGVGGSTDGFLGLCVLRCVRTGADSTRARRRRSAVQKQYVYSHSNKGAACSTPHVKKKALSASNYPTTK